MVYNKIMNTNDEKILHLYHQGVDTKEIMQETGLSRSKVYQVIHNEKNNITPEYKKRGRKEGEKRLLTSAQEQTLYQQLITTKPDEHFLSDTSAEKVWTRKNIQALIGNTFDMQVSDHTVKNYLHRFQLLYQNPEMQTKHDTLCIAAVNLNGENQVYKYIPEQIFSGCRDVYMIYAYDSRGTYYFCVYDENTSQEGIPVLSRIHDFLTRMGKQYQYIHCYIPKNLYNSNLYKNWNRHNKSPNIQGKFEFFKLNQEELTV